MRILSLLLCSIGFLFASVSLNTASEKELATLKGVGSKKAMEIVKYRESNGCFESIEDLAKVKGIGKKTVEKNRDNLILGDCPK